MVFMALPQVVCCYLYVSSKETFGWCTKWLSGHTGLAQETHRPVLSFAKEIQLVFKGNNVHIMKYGDGK